MPLGKGVRYRFKGSGKSRIRLAFRSSKAIERTKWPEGGRKGKPRLIRSTYGALSRMAKRRG